MVDAFLNWLASLPALATYLVLMLLSALENFFPPVPADVAVALGAFLANRGEVNPVLLGVLCWLANCGSAAWTYWLGRRHGVTFFASGFGKRIVPPGAMDVLRDAYQKHGALGVFVSRFFPGIRAAVTPFAGAAGLSPTRALVPTALASGIWYALLIFAGCALGLGWPAVKSLVERVTGALAYVGLAAAAIAALWLWRRQRAKR